MNKKKWYWQGVALLACGALLTACSPAQAVGSGKTGDTQTTTTLQPTSSTVSSTVQTTTQPTDVATTTAKKTTTKKKTTTTVTGTPNLTPATKPSGEFIPHLTKPASTDSRLTFSYESEDYDILRQAILKDFPEEKALDEFRAYKVKCDEGNSFGADFYVAFMRYINGCQTEAHYTLYFDSQGNFLKYDYKNPVYDATKVKAPRAATEQEIEQAKKQAAATFSDDELVWEQSVGTTRYIIELDWNYFQVNTIYAPKSAAEQFGYLDPNSPNYGKTPPHSMRQHKYEINR